MVRALGSYPSCRRFNSYHSQTIGSWCNGSIRVSKTFGAGSNPAEPEEENIMKKILVVLFMVLFSFSVFAENKMTVGLWVNVSDGMFRDRVVNEITAQMHNSREWPFEVRVQNWDADIHVIVSGMLISDINTYAWGITYTPIYFPRYTNGIAGTSNATISGMNWIAREVVKYVEEQLYFLMDDLNRQNM